MSLSDRPPVTTPVAPAGAGFIRDPRHRYSLELRPDVELDGSLRDVAVQLEARGLLLPGAASAPRFHPHVTFLRAAAIPGAVAELVAHEFRGNVDTQLDIAGTFGFGRIVHVASSERHSLDAARAAALATIPADQLDPIVLERFWTPHVTLAYAVPSTCRTAALHHVAGLLPLVGRWGSVEVWDLDVRPTRLVRRVQLRSSG